MIGMLIARTAPMIWIWRTERSLQIMRLMTEAMASTAVRPMLTT